MWTKMEVGGCGPRWRWVHENQDGGGCTRTHMMDSVSGAKARDRELSRNG